MHKIKEPSMSLRTADEVLCDFKKRGISIAEWARNNAFNPALVYLVLRGKTVPTRGQTHRIAVSLGIKDGFLDSEVNFLENKKLIEPSHKKGE